MSLTWPAKNPIEVLDYEVDWTARLAVDTISTSVFTLTVAAGLTISSQSHTTTKATLWLSGGTAGAFATINNTVVTAGGRTMEEVITLAIQESLIVEDGTGKATADSYNSLAAADLYHAKRGNAAWSALAAGVREGCLRRAADYMLAIYRPQWAGYRTTTTQALDWPRYNVPMRDAPSGVFGTWAAYYPNNTVPTAVANAHAELALKANAGDLTPDLTQAIKSEKIGQIETVYQDYSTATKTYRSIDNLLSPFLAAQGGIRVMRG